MIKGWPLVPLGEILTERRELPAREALAAGDVQIVAKIGFKDGTLQFRSDVDTKTGMILIRPGDLVISGINAAKGAIALYKGTNISVVAATIHYGAYIPNKTRVDVSYLWWLLRSRTFRDLLLEYVPNGIKTELKAKRLLPIPVPLPPLAEQQRTVARIEALAARIAEAQGLRHQAGVEAQLFTQAFLEKTYTLAINSFGSAPLTDLCNTITDGDHITPPFAEEGVRFIFVGNVSSGYLHFNGSKYVQPEYYTNLRPQRKPKRGDILYSAVGATLGIPAIVDSDEAFCFQRHIAIIKPDRRKLHEKFLWYMLRSRPLYEKAWSKTTGSAQPTVPLGAIREFLIPTPPLSEQHRLVAYLDDLQAQVNALKAVQVASAAELDALLPAVLDRAFKGEL